MGDLLIFYVFINIMLFTLIFWVLCLFLGLFKKKKSKYKNDFYECGFKTNSDLKINVSNHFFFICLILILYDIEFLFLFPIISNSEKLSTYELFLLIFIFFTFLIAVYFDNNGNFNNQCY